MWKVNSAESKGKLKCRGRRTRTGARHSQRFGPSVTKLPGKKNTTIECIYSITQFFSSSSVFRTIHIKILLIWLSLLPRIPVTDRLLLAGVIAAQRWHEPCQKQAEWSHERFTAAPKMTAHACYFVWCWDGREIKRLALKKKKTHRKDEIR